MGGRGLEAVQPRGFYNLGNTCYLGSLVQALVVLEQLGEFLKRYALFAERMLEKGPKITEKQKNELKLIKSLYDICIPLIEEKTAPAINPLYSAVCEVDRNFSGNAEQDAHELLVMLTTAAETAAELRDHHYKRDRGTSFKRFPMSFEIETLVQCHECRSETKSKESNVCHSVDVETAGEVDHWKAFKTVESMSGANQYYCSKCEKKVNASKTVKLLSLPSVLALHYKVFKLSIENGRADLSKINNVPLAPFRISLSDIIPREMGEYRLRSMIVHTGNSLDHGHYLCFRPMDDNFREWEMYNDQHHYRGTFQDMENNLTAGTPYLMFYEKAEEDNNNEPAT